MARILPPAVMMQSTIRFSHDDVCIDATETFRTEDELLNMGRGHRTAIQQPLSLQPGLLDGRSVMPTP